MNKISTKKRRFQKGIIAMAVMAAVSFFSFSCEAKIMRVSAYCPCKICCGKWAGNGHTASGHAIKKGDRFVAAPKNYPFGTKLVVPGYNGNRPVSVEDRGGAIKGDRLDVYFDDHKTALDWGVKYLEIKEIK